jgi:hypothetical protein
VNQIHRRVENILVFDDDCSLNSDIFNEVIHAVKTTQERRFAAA